MTLGRLRTLVTVATVGVVALVGLALAGPATPAGPGTAAAAAARALRISHALVYAQEWSLWSSRATVPAGRVYVQLWNRGQDAHDLAIRRLNARGAMIASAQTVGVTQSGQLREASWALRPGTYELYCTMPGHLKAGMHARIVVTR